MDDVWSIEVWDKVKMLLPDNGNGSRVMVTTRILDVAHRVREIILRLLRQIREPLEKEYQETTQTSNNEQRDNQLGEQLYKELWGRKYLIVMDDVWSIEVWDKVKMLLPDNGNGSRVMVTTRILDVAHRLGSCSPYIVNFLDANESWRLLCQIVFGQESCSIESETVAT
ncbi:putative late blight resistance protein homolog R1A-3 [Primulina eburnea]|uniref:putative late blight resistance protein homolog R1A-3 n=1 Tax=Primulina eburnea TaxID=1245227 RepID=UPI003C6C59D5